ncbi:hypothetical protein SNE40_003608 [Patella caerulea]|uniref:Gustatory receptor n=1 Tax=Patella caerulea TaxID=87958 RepID=A0AAN8Q0F5_PATCE
MKPGCDKDVWQKDTSKTYQSIKPFLHFMAIFGLYRIGRGSHCSTVLLTALVILQVAILLWCIAKVIWCFNGADVAQDESLTVASITILTQFLVCLLTLILGLRFLPVRINKFLKMCDNLMSNPFFEVSIVHYRKRTMTFSIIAMVAIVICAIFVIFINPPFVSDFACVRSPVTQNRPIIFWLNTTILPLLVFFVLGNKISVHGSLFILMAFVKKEFSRCNDEFKKLLDSIPTEKKVQEIKERYFLVCQLCENLDATFNPLDACIMFLNSLWICTQIYTIASNPLSFASVMFNCSFIIIELVELSVLILQGASLNQEAKQCLETSKYLDGTKMGHKTIAMVTLFAENMRSTEVGLSFMKLFIIKKSTIITIVGTLISYIIVVIQFRPG